MCRHKYSMLAHLKLSTNINFKSDGLDPWFGLGLGFRSHEHPFESWFVLMPVGGMSFSRTHHLERGREREREECSFRQNRTENSLCHQEEDDRLEDQTDDDAFLISPFADDVKNSCSCMIVVWLLYGLFLLQILLESRDLVYHHSISQSPLTSTSCRRSVYFCLSLALCSSRQNYHKKRSSLISG